MNVTTMDTQPEEQDNVTAETAVMENNEAPIVDSMEEDSESRATGSSFTPIPVTRTKSRRTSNIASSPTISADAYFALKYPR